MLNKSSLRLGVIAVSVATAFGSYASVQDVTETVKGRPATVSNVTIKNKSAENLNPAQGDTLEATYTYTDPDGIPEDTNQSAYRWLADGTAAGEAVGDNTFVPGSSVLNKFLQVQITAAESAPSDPDKAAMVESSQTNAPVLPSRTEFNSLYHFSTEANMRWGDAYMYCANRNERLMSLSELQDLYINYTRATSAPAAENNSDLNQTYGVGLSTVAWSTQGGDTNHSYAYIQSNGGTASNLNSNTYEVVCAKFGPPELLPSVINASFANPVEGIEITPVYTYQGNATIPDRSRFEWKRANDQIGTGSVVVATTKTYTPVTEDVGKYLVLTIYPASYDTVIGNNVQPAGKIVKAQEQSFPAGTTLEANGYDFAIDSDFPTTGFSQAKFQVQISGNASNNTGYTWSTDQSWASIDNNGVVTFTGTPSGSNKSVKITASKNNTLYSKTISVNKWYLAVNSGQMKSWSEASNYCSTRGGQPSISEITNAVFGTDGTRVTGRLWGEWGSLPRYAGSGFSFNYSGTDALYWSSQSDSGDGPSNPSIASVGDRSWVTYSSGAAIVCRSNL